MEKNTQHVEETAKDVKAAYAVIKCGLVALALTALCLCAVAAKAADWSTEFKVEESVYQASKVADTLQTVYVAQHPDKFQEAGSAWAIGRHPSTAAVVGYMVAIGAIHLGITDLLIREDAPHWVTRTWEVVSITDSVSAVAHNYSIGVKFQF